MTTTFKPPPAVATPRVGSRVVFWFGPPKHRYLTAGTVSAIDATSVTIDHIADWSRSVTLVLPLSSIHSVKGRRNHRRVKG